MPNGFDNFPGLEAATTAARHEPGSPIGRRWRMIEWAEGTIGAACALDTEHGVAMPTRLEEALRRIEARGGEPGRLLPLDTLWFVAWHAKPALRAITARCRSRLVREYQLMPAREVREFDERMMAWLSARPGRTPRELLGGSPKVLGIVRRETANTVENRLVLWFCGHLERAIGRRLDTDGHSDARYWPHDSSHACAVANELASIRRLCRDMRELPGWDEVEPAVPKTPNNPLLADRFYSRIWRAWQWLRGWERNAAERWVDGAVLVREALFWATMARMRTAGKLRVIDVPCLPQPGLMRQRCEVQQLVSGQADISWTRQPYARFLGRTRNKACVAAIKLRDPHAATFAHDECLLPIEIETTISGTVHTRSGIEAARERLDLRCDLVGALNDAKIGETLDRFARDVESKLARMVEQPLAPYAIRAPAYPSLPTQNIIEAAATLPSPARNCAFLDLTCSNTVVATAAGVSVPSPVLTAGALRVPGDRWLWVDARAHSAWSVGSDTPLFSFPDLFSPNAPPKGLDPASGAIHLIRDALHEPEKIDRVVLGIADDLSPAEARRAANVLAAAWPDKRTLCAPRSVCLVMGAHSQGAQHGFFGAALVLDADSHAPSLTVLRQCERDSSLKAADAAEDDAIWQIQRTTSLEDYLEGQTGWSGAEEEILSKAQRDAGIDPHQALLWHKRAMMHGLLAEYAPLVSGEILPLGSPFSSHEHFLGSLAEAVHESLAAGVGGLVDAAVATAVAPGLRIIIALPSWCPWAQNSDRPNSLIWKLKQLFHRRFPEAEIIFDYGRRTFAAIGGIELAQRWATGCPTWRTHLPALKLHANRNGAWTELDLAGREAIEGTLAGTVIAAVSQRMHCPPGIGAAQFVFSLGDPGRHETILWARLDSSALPLRQAAELELSARFDPSEEVPFTLAARWVSEELKATPLAVRWLAGPDEDRVQSLQTNPFEPLGWNRDRSMQELRVVLSTPRCKQALPNLEKVLQRDDAPFEEILRVCTELWSTAVAVLPREGIRPFFDLLASLGTDRAPHTAAALDLLVRICLRVPQSMRFRAIAALARLLRAQGWAKGCTVDRALVKRLLEVCQQQSGLVAQRLSEWQRSSLLAKAPRLHEETERNKARLNGILASLSFQTRSSPENWRVFFAEIQERIPVEHPAERKTLIIGQQIDDDIALGARLDHTVRLTTNMSVVLIWLASFAAEEVQAWQRGRWQWASLVLRLDAIFSENRVEGWKRLEPLRRLTVASSYSTAGQLAQLVEHTLLGGPRPLMQLKPVGVPAAELPAARSVILKDQRKASPTRNKPPGPHLKATAHQTSPAPTPKPAEAVPKSNRVSPAPETKAKSLPPQPAGAQGADIRIPLPIIVRDLATALGLKPFHVVRDLMNLNVFVRLNQSIKPDVAQKVCLGRGFDLRVQGITAILRKC